MNCKALRAPMSAAVFAFSSLAVSADEPGGHSAGPDEAEANEDRVSGDMPLPEPSDSDEPTGENQGPPGDG